MVLDPISDLLTRIRNANQVYLSEVIVPYSKMKWQVAHLLKEEGFIKDCEEVKEESNPFKAIKLTLKYGSNRKRVISGVKRISKPGCRVYSSIRELKQYRKAFGITVLSTPKGIVTDKIAYRQKIGGEVLFSMW